MSTKKRTAEEHYADLFGARWLPLKEAILAKKNSRMRVNGFCKPGVLAELDFLEYDEAIAGMTSRNGLRLYYIMDPASAYVARLLPVERGRRVLDACAAPGGKSLILAEKAWEVGAYLQLNELSRSRRERLKRVLNEYVPAKFREKIQISGYNAELFGIHRPNHYSSILLDVPCSSEAHILRRPEKWSEYSPKRSTNLAKRQYSLLTSALLALRPGGTLVYSTCALSPLENDGVIEKLHRKKKDDFTVVPIPPEALPGAERTKYGYQFLPDKSAGGPMYVVCLRKAM